MWESDEAVEQWSTDQPQEDMDISSYWNRVTAIWDGLGEKKYTNPGVTVKSALTLSHGNAIPERGFSVNNSLLSKKRLALSEEAIVGERVIKEVVRIYGPAANIPITKDMISCARKVHAEYLLYLEKERNEQKIKEEVKRKQELIAKERMDILERKSALFRSKISILSRKLIAEQETLEVAQLQEQDITKQVMGEAATKLSLSVQHNDIKEAKVAQVMLSAGNAQLQDTSQQLAEIREEKEKLQKKYSHLEQKEKADVGLDPPAGKKMKRNGHFLKLVSDMISAILISINFYAFKYYSRTVNIQYNNS